jgi:2-C-methyl-D-erythritol 2,4-cyclodiphosphate synthase
MRSSVPPPWVISEHYFPIPIRVNLDVIVHAQLPKLGPYKGQIKRRVAGLLETDFANVNIKAKTNEGLDAVGEGRAIACTTTVLLKRRLK